MTVEELFRRVIVWPALMLALFALAIAGLSMIAGDASAAPQPPRTPCAKAAVVAEQLAKKYGEVPVSFGIQGNGNLLQVYMSEAKGTWTLVSTTPGGMSCVLAAGKDWHRLPTLEGEPV